MKNRFEELLEQLSREKGGERVLFDARGGGSMTYREFYQAVQTKGEALGRAGLEPGSRVLLMMDNSFSFAVNFFAVTFCRGIVVPVNTNLKTQEIAYLIEDTGAVGILVEERYRERLPETVKGSDWQDREHFLETAEGTGRQDREHPLETAEGAGRQDREHFLETVKGSDWQDRECLSGKKRGGSQASLEDYLPLGQVSQNDLPEGTAMLLYTSGTTGHPKGVILSFDNLLAKTRDIIEAHALTNRDRVLCVLPWFHINGLVITLLTPLVSGQKIVIGGKFSVSRFWQYVEEYEITWFSGVPTMYSHLLARGIPEYGRHSSLRFARSASSALPGAVLREFEQLCQVPVIESYGITEGCAQITSNPLPPAAHKTNSVGLAYGNRIKIVDGNGQEVPSGVSGEVWIKGENVTCGYYHKEEENQKSFTEGWFHSGDVGYLDSEGYLFLNGRIKELINRAGEKFSPLEVDEVLYQIPQVELAAAVGVPDPVYGEEVVCFLKLKEGEILTDQEVKSWCEKQLAGYKVPKEVFFVSQIPQGGNGKIQRLKLVEVYNRQKEGAASEK